MPPNISIFLLSKRVPHIPASFSPSFFQPHQAQSNPVKPFPASSSLNHSCLTLFSLFQLHSTSPIPTFHGSLSHSTPIIHNDTVHLSVCSHGSNQPRPANER
ncbi:hypothetical protein E2C01_064511 [Portunus trituberculatus]|uniref:Uncharacterized protein n=1 Tax=Portunus trituberculatus TaxID=210409 RepID=A0A5B7HKI9_PORTR|nr:hypothetical protein [Portunus trituberculatus]